MVDWVAFGMGEEVKISHGESFGWLTLPSFSWFNIQNLQNGIFPGQDAGWIGKVQAAMWPM